MQKKSITDFLTEVIIPIEKKQVDDGNVYMLIKSFPKLDLPGVRRPGLEYEESEIDVINYDKWSLPKSDKPGEWHTIESTSSPIEKFFRLTSLAGLIWHGEHSGNLYRVEYEGQSQRLGLEDFIYYGSSNMSAEQQSEMDAKIHIDNCIPLGIRVKKVRLVSRVENWTPFLLWSFLIDCAEHCYSLHQPSDSAISKSYKDGIEFSRAYSKYECDMGVTEIEQQLKQKSDVKGFYDLVHKRRREILDKIKIVVDGKDPATPNLGRAVLACLEIFGRVFEGVNEARIQNAWSFRSKYYDNYEFPSIHSAKGTDEKNLKRIWYALLKEELDWQVTHLFKLMEN
ncbi:MAG: hypothetical protein K8S20_14210 [Chloroflexi bacterium]|nr:hypothetical protein [Chloroflexota bacterium]